MHVTKNELQIQLLLSNEKIQYFGYCCIIAFLHIRFWYIISTGEAQCEQLQLVINDHSD